MAAWPLFNAIGETASHYGSNALLNLQPLTEFSVSEDLTIDLKDYGSYVHPLALSQVPFIQSNLTNIADG
jgi:hypothetical protein